MYVIYTKENCPWCLYAKNEFSKHHVPYQEVKITAESKQTLLEMAPNATTAPAIFKGDMFIGGYQNLVEHFKKEEEVAGLLLG